MTANPTSIQAASVLVVRSTPPGALEVLLLRRAARSRSFADFWVFPGGKLDAADHERSRALPAAQATSLPRELHPYAIAAWRELLEETGGDDSLCNDASCLTRVLQEAIYWSHWHAPSVATPPFDTRFLLLDAALLPHEPRPDGQETVQMRWVRPEVALDERRTGQLATAPPTAINLAELAIAARTADSVPALLEQERLREVIRIKPRIDRSGPHPTTVLPWDAGFASLEDSADSPVPENIPARYLELPSRLPASRRY